MASFLPLLLLLVLAAPAPSAPGEVDAAFDGDGKLTTNIGVGRYDKAYAVTTQADGKIVAAGTGNNGDFAVVRYNPGGAADTTFGPGGRRTTDFSPVSDPDYRDEAYDVVVQPDGKIVAVGDANSYSPGTQKFAAARYNPNGGLDASFSNDGKLTTGFATGSVDGAHTLTIQRDGKLVAAGFSNRNSSGAEHDFAVTRYRVDTAAAATNLSLSSSKTSVPSGGSAVLPGRLTASGDPIGGKSVGVFRTTDGGRTWAKIATAPYSPSAKAYKFTLSNLKRTAYYQMRFSGNPSYRAVNSAAVPVKVY